MRFWDFCIRKGWPASKKIKPIGIIDSFCSSTHCSGPTNYSRPLVNLAAGTFMTFGRIYSRKLMWDRVKETF
jgi:hypothetical protein